MSSKSIAPPDKRSYRGLDNDARVAERRARLIAAAVTCFGTHGYHYTTLKMLCAQAGLTERYFYESFANADDLLCCAFDDAASAIMADVQARMANTGEAPAEKVRAGADAYLKAIAADPTRARLVLAEIEGASDNAAAACQRQVQRHTDLIQQDLFGAKANTGARDGLSPRMLSNALVGALVHLARQWLRAGCKPGRATLVRHIDALVRGTLAAWDAQAGVPL